MASTAPNPSPPKRTLHPLDTGVVLEDVKCGSCGYPVKGIPKGKPCPECGTPVRAVGRRGDSLLGAPFEYLISLRHACLMMVVAASLLIIQPGIVALAWMGGSPAAAMMVMAAAQSLWIWGVWMATAPRSLTMHTRTDLRQEWGRVRALARFTQLGWPVTALFYFLGTGAKGPVAVAMGVAALLTMGAALYGLTFVGTYFSRLSHWAMDTGLAMRWSAASVGLGILGPLTVVCLAVPTITQWPALSWMGMLGIVLSLVYGVSFCLFVFCIYQFGWMAHAAVRSKQAQIDRDDRLVEKARRNREDQLAGRAPRDHRLIDDDTPCRKCKYNVRGLKYGDRCPECGTTIGSVV